MLQTCLNKISPGTFNPFPMSFPWTKLLTTSSSRLAVAHLRCARRPTAPYRAHAQRAGRAVGQREGAARRANRRWGGGESRRPTAPYRAHAQRAGRAVGQREGAARRANRRWGGGESTLRSLTQETFLLPTHHRLRKFRFAFVSSLRPEQHARTSQSCIVHRA